MSGVWVGLAITAVGAGASYYQGQKAAEANEEATKAQQRASSVESARARISAIREARIRAAQIMAQAGEQGMGQASSGVAGALSSIGSQTGANLGAINVQQGFADAASSALQSAADSQLKAQGWQAIGSVGSGIFNASGGWAKIFGGNTPEGVRDTPAPVEYRTGKP